MLVEPKAGFVKLNAFPPKLNALCEGCTAAGVMHVAVVSGILEFESGGFVPSRPSVADGDKDSAAANEEVDEADLKVSLFDDAALIPKELLADGTLEPSKIFVVVEALELLLLDTSLSRRKSKIEMSLVHLKSKTLGVDGALELLLLALFIPKTPFADGTSELLLLEMSLFSPKTSFADGAFPTSIVGCIKGFTAQVCVLNSSSRFLLFVSGSR